MLFFKSIIFSGLNCPPLTALSDVKEGVQENLRAGGEVNTLPFIHVLFPSLTDSFLVDVLRNPSSLCCQPRTQFLTKKRSPKKRNRSGFSHVFSCQHSERALVKEETPHSRTGPGLSVWPESNHLKSWNSRKPSFLRVRREHLHNSTLDVPAQPECFINSN